VRVYIFRGILGGAVAVAAASQRDEKRQSRKMERGTRDNWPIIVDRDDTRALSQNYSRTVARGRIQFGAASTLTGKKEKKEAKRERREGRTLKGLQG